MCIYIGVYVYMYVYYICRYSVYTIYIDITYIMHNDIYMDNTIYICVHRNIDMQMMHISTYITDIYIYTCCIVYVCICKYTHTCIYV